MDEVKEIIASAIANARGMRKGMPSVSNVIKLLPENLALEIYDDVDNIIGELGDAGYEITKGEN